MSATRSHRIVDRDIDRLLHDCLRARCSSVAAKSLRADNRFAELNWERFLETVADEDLGPLLYDTIRDWGVFPPSVEERLAQAYYGNATRNALLLGILEHILVRLAAEGVPVLLLKGVALAQTVYRNAALRPMIDMDLLVRRQDVRAARRILTEFCGTHDRAQPNDGADEAHESQSVFIKPGTIETVIDLHWNALDSRYYPHARLTEWAWENASPVHVGATRAFVLDGTALVLHLCGHVWMDRRETRLLPLHDIAQVLTWYADQLEWYDVLTRAPAFGLARPLKDVLTRVILDWQVPVPNDILARLMSLQASPAEDKFFAWLTVTNRPATLLVAANWASMRSWRERFGYLLCSLFPLPSYMQRRYSIRHRFLIPLSYPYRWFRALKNSLFRFLPSRVRSVLSP